MAEHTDMNDTFTEEEIQILREAHLISVGQLFEDRLARMEDANKDLEVFRNVDCVLVGDLRELITVARAYKLLKSGKGVARSEVEPA
jgi:hypothetical protein